MNRKTKPFINPNMTVVHRTRSTQHPTQSRQRAMTLSPTSNSFRPSISNILIPDKNELIVVPIHSICYVKASGSYTDIVVNNDKTYTVSKSIKEWLKSEKVDFIRCHQSYAVNPHDVRAIVDRSHLRLSNDELIPIARRQYQQTINALK